MILKILLSFGFCLSAFASEPEFDHNFKKWTAILQKVVVPGENGKSTRLKYAELKATKEDLYKVTSELSAVTVKQFEKFNQEQQIAFLANSYNAFMVKLVIDNYPITSVKKLGIPFVGPWKKNYIPLLGKTMSLDNIEHGTLRKNYKEPRIHFAINCASVGCPPIRGDAFVASKLSQQLEEQGKFFFANDSQNSFNETTKTLKVSSIFKWFQEDFESEKYKKDAGVAEFSSKYMPNLAKFSPAEIKVEYTDYNWDLNDALKSSGALSPMKIKSNGIEDVKGTQVDESQNQATSRVRFAGSTTVAPLITAISNSQELKTRFNKPLLVDTQGGSKGGLLALASGDADVAMISSEFTAKEQQVFGDKEVLVKEMGKDALGIVVSKDVFSAGIKNISLQTLRDIYSSKFTNWQQVAQAEKVSQFSLNRPIVFFNKEPGRGTREAFLHFVYGKAELAPATQHPVVGSNQEVVSRLSKAQGAISLLSASWVAKSTSIAALSVEGVLPNENTIANKTYPFVRPLNLVILKNTQAKFGFILNLMTSNFAQKIISNEGVVATVSKEVL